MHKALVQHTSEKSIIITIFHTDVPHVLGGPKAGRDISNPLSDIKTQYVWYSQYTMNGVQPG